MKKIGFIDFFIDEWHANNYPAMIGRSALKDEFEVAFAYEDATPAGKRTLQQSSQFPCRDVPHTRTIRDLLEQAKCQSTAVVGNREPHDTAWLLWKRDDALPVSHVPFDDGAIVICREQGVSTRAE